MTWDEQYQQLLEKLREGDNICPIMYAVSVIGQKWKIPILWQLAKHDAPMRFGEIRRARRLRLTIQPIGIFRVCADQVLYCV